MNEIVSIQHRKAVTTSLIVAEVFRKQHKDVKKAIENLMAELPEKDRRNFAPIFVSDSYGRKQPAYEINRDAFTLLAMGFNGKKALMFKLQYIDAFNRMERALLNRENLSWQEQRLNSKIARRVETDSIARFVDYATDQGSQNARLYYMNVTKMTHQALSIMKQAGPQSIRDTIDSMQLSFLTTAEYMIQQVLEDGMTAGLHYKDIFRLAKDLITSYAATLPLQRLISA